ncbi:hypothetical protein M378DRAFT_160075 [Amanita muscaria Koide BX008]|uniref:Uncharacterized protein n=1 Tax=Amanita muscaria (strain Koide BX008) TaxID=946122 RepID=A0A0C2XE55_AMAMK|nr:hypothetical protein M378DRAFT_160075 [Amanita muscaria Koide BX008]
MTATVVDIRSKSLGVQFPRSVTFSVPGVSEVPCLALLDDRRCPYVVVAADRARCSARCQVRAGLKRKAARFDPGCHIWPVLNTY